MNMCKTTAGSIVLHCPLEVIIPQICYLLSYFFMKWIIFPFSGTCLENLLCLEFVFCRRLAYFKLM